MDAGSAAEQREHFIPVRKSDLIEALLAEPRLADPAARSGFRQFAWLLGAIFHHEHFAELEQLRDAYHDFNPHRPANPDAASEAADRLINFDENRPHAHLKAALSHAIDTPSRPLA